MLGGKKRKRCQVASPHSKRSWRPETGSVEAEALCERCRRIHAEAGDIRIRPDAGAQIAKVNEDLQQLLGSPCAFCRLLGSIKDASLDGRECRLYAYSANSIYARVRIPTLKRHDISSSVLLGIVASTARSTKLEATDYIGIVDPKQEGKSNSIGPRRVAKDRINYAMIQSWITFCQSKHGHLCSPPITKIIERLRVIDVDSLRVIAAPENCNYVALSYVWGSHATPTDSFSQVVRDSSVVAKKLGYKYLWVDKHCIDQDSPADKHEQVQAMHVIYGNARLTLIAAAGEDCQYGLPGVASRERIEQSALSIDGNLYVQNFPHVSQAVGGSRWATRGWTLQEGLLSHRRLIFTDHQVAFQCYGMHCVEAVHWPYELMHAKSSHRFPENVPRPPLGRQIQDQQYYNTLQPDFKLLSLLEEYSNRTLSYPSDSLNAFLGVLSSFASRKHPIYHVWGVPLTHHRDEWELKLNWRHRQPCSRQAQFPSWSWAGWSGPVTRGRQVLRGGRNNFLIYLEGNNSQGDEAKVIELQEFGAKHNMYHAYASASPFLRLSIWAVNLELTHVSWDGFGEAAKRAYYAERNLANPHERKDDAFREGLYVKLPRRGYTELAFFYLDDKNFDAASLHEKSLTGMMYDNDPSSFDITFIILVSRDEGRYERLGYVLFQPAEQMPTTDIAFRLANGRLSKVRPDIAPVTGEREQLLWDEQKRGMVIRLG